MEEKVIRPNRSEPMLSSWLNSRGCRDGLPIGGNFELTARCNFNCKMCYVHLQSDSDALRRQELTADQWLSIASDARDMGMIFLLLTGGEPFLREDFPYLYEQLIKMGIMVSINTNASLYNEELRRLFLRYPPSRINATLYGGSEKTYASLCGNPSFERVVSNLRQMKEDGLQVRLNVSLTPHNACDMEKIDAISREIGLQAKAAAYMYPPVRVDGTKGENTGRFSAREAGQAMAQWHAIRDDREHFLSRAQALRHLESAELTETCVDVEQEGVQCRAGRSSFWMTWDGKMMPCGTMDAGAAYPLRDGFAEAWRRVREYTAAIRMPKSCAACPKRKNCSVCASICKGETGEFDCRPSYLCEMTDSMICAILSKAEEVEAQCENPV